MWKQKNNGSSRTEIFFEVKEIALKYLLCEHFWHCLAWQ